MLSGNVKAATLCKIVEHSQYSSLTKGSDEFTDMNRKIPVVFKR